MPHQEQLLSVQNLPDIRWTERNFIQTELPIARMGDFSVRTDGAILIAIRDARDHVPPPAEFRRVAYEAYVLSPRPDVSWRLDPVGSFASLPPVDVPRCERCKGSGRREGAMRECVCPCCACELCEGTGHKAHHRIRKIACPRPAGLAPGQCSYAFDGARITLAMQILGWPELYPDASSWDVVLWSTADTIAIDGRKGPDAWRIVLMRLSDNNPVTSDLPRWPDAGPR